MTEPSEPTLPEVAVAAPPAPPAPEQALPASEQAVPSRADLRGRIDALGLADQRRLGKRWHRAKGADERAKVADAVAKAEAALDRRRAAVPKVTYSDDLPITDHHDELMAALADHQVVIVAGETGSGKSTQIPKLCLESGRGITGMIGHTQPRRVAARTIAARVAEELDTELGSAVGYAVRFDDRVSDGAYVKVMTDGLLLAEMQRDRLLSAYDTLIVDEAHERSLNVDFLLGYLKQLLPQRPDLKVIITSATIDTQRFSAHFDDAPVISVSGRTFPVELRYRPYGQLIPAHPHEEGDDVIDDDRDQIEAVCDAVAELAREGDGDVLVFLSGEREIRDTAKALEDRVRPGTEILPLYARLSSAEQQRVFKAHRNRRIVLATNVAETSLTVPGVRYVVDAGTARISRYSHRLKVQRLPIEAISQASANQRAGRCGRVAPGICIRLFAEDDFDERPEFTDPEIQRTNLASVILQMTNLGLGDVAAFPFLDPPDPRAVRDGVALLEELGALAPDVPADERALTKVGRQLVGLPIDPRLGRMVLESDRWGSTREVLIIAAALSIQDPRERPTDKQQAADELHRRFKVPGSDLLSLVALWDHLEERRKALSSNAFRRECRAEYLNYLRIREWRDLYRQVARAAAKLDLVPDDGNAHPDHVHRALLAGLLSQMGLKDRETKEFRGARNSRFMLAHASALSRKPPAWIMVAELVETNRLWGRMAAGVDPLWAEELAVDLVKRSYGDPRWDERSGRAVTNERVTLYGLPLVTDRTVGYDRVDVVDARDAFIEHALVRREWRSPHRFLVDNEAFLTTASGLSDRLRRVDLFDDHALFGFYDRHIGDEVVSGRHFDRWWKQARRERPELLTLTVDDLLDDGVVYDPTDYPDTWHQGDLALPVTYRFAPGEDLDGVTVHVPMAVLDRLESWDFDWQVPGLRWELVETLVTKLPKTIRRELIPLAENARRAADTITWQDRPVVDALADVVADLAGVKVRADHFDVVGLPAHLRITFAITDGNQVVAVGKDLDALKELVGGRMRAAVARAHATVERGGITHWDLGDLPTMVRTTTADGYEAEGYPALLDEGASVAIKVFSRPELAKRVHAIGVKRLLLLNVTVGVKNLARDVPNQVQLAFGALDDLTFGAVLRDVISASANRVVADQMAESGDVRDGAAFDALVARGRANLKPTAVQALRHAGAIVVLAAQVETKLDNLGGTAVDDAVADARSHLHRLVRPGFVAAAGTARLPDVERYVQGIAKRLDKVVESPGRDRASMAEVAAVEHRYRRLLDALTASQVTTRVVECGWTLEELRVSTFAQTVGVKGSVSLKRVRREIDALFAGELD